MGRMSLLSELTDAMQKALDRAAPSVTWLDVAKAAVIGMVIAAIGFLIDAILRRLVERYGK